MREFLEKRWWGGVAVIIALMLGLPALIQYFGKVSISWLAVTIALNIILVIALVLVAIWNTKLKHKYELISKKLETIQEYVKTTEQRKKRARVFLEDTDNIQKLNIDNRLLTELYGQAHGIAISQFQDAKLSDIDIIVHPYQYNRASLLFGFYSMWADRNCTYIISEVGDIGASTPSEPAKDDDDRIIFTNLPWIEAPTWPEFIRKSYEKVGPLPIADWTQYHLWARAYNEPKWGISFEDGVTGKEYNLKWDGKGAPVLEE